MYFTMPQYITVSTMGENPGQTELDESLVMHAAACQYIDITANSKIYRVYQH